MAGAVGALAGPFIAGQLADRSFATEKLLAVSHLIGAVLVYFLTTAADFNTFLVLSFLYGLVYAPTLALTNSISFANLPNRDRDFAPVRLWGTIGWIAAGIFVGQVLYRFHTPSGEGVTPDAIAAAQNAGRVVAFQVSAVLGVIMAVYCLTLPHTPPAKSAKERTAWLEALGEVRKQPLVTLFLIAVPISMIHQFYFVFTAGFVSEIQNAANSENANAFAKTVNEVLGVGGGGLMTIGQMTEFAVLALMPFLALTFSRKTLLLTGIAAYALRMALFAYAPELPFVLMGVALHGLCFGCFIFVAFMIVDENTTPDIRATTQNLFNFVIIGIGIIGVSLPLLWWRFRHTDREALQGIAWAMFVVVLFVPAALPWYYTWPLAVISALAQSRPAIALIAGFSTWIMVIFKPDGAHGMYSWLHVLLATACAVAAWRSLRRETL